MKNQVKFSIHGKDLIKIIQRVQSLAGSQITGAIHIKASKKQCLEIQAEMNGRRVLVKADCTVSKPGSFLIEKKLIESIGKNRGQLNFSLNDKGLGFSSGNYTGAIPIRPMPDNIDLLKFEIKEAFFPKELQIILQKAVKKCLLQSVFGTDKLSLFMQLRNSVFYVGVADKFHAAYTAIAAKKYKDSLRNYIEPYLLPIDYANLLAQFFNEEQVNIFNLNNKIVFTDQSAMLELPALQTQDFFLDSLLAIETHGQITIKANELKIALDNCGMDNADLSFIFEKEAKAIKLRFKAEHGHIVDTVSTTSAIKKSHTLKLDLKNLEDVVNKITQEEVILSYNQHVLTIVENNTTYLSQLLQEEK